MGRYRITRMEIKERIFVASLFKLGIHVADSNAKYGLAIAMWSLW